MSVILPISSNISYLISGTPLYNPCTVPTAAASISISVLFINFSISSIFAMPVPTEVTSSSCPQICPTSASTKMPFFRTSLTTLFVILIFSLSVLSDASIITESHPHSAASCIKSISLQ